MKLVCNYFSCNDATICLMHYEKRKKEYLIACICESAEGKEAFEKFSKEFVVMFKIKELESFILKSEHLIYGVVIVGNKFKLFGNVEGGCYTCNFRFNKPYLKQLPFLQEGELEKGASILVCNQSFHSHLSNQEMANSLCMRNPTEKRIGLHLKELGEENISRSKQHKGASIYIAL